MEFGSEENVLKLVSTSFWCFLMVCFKTKSTTNRRVLVGVQECLTVCSKIEFSVNNFVVNIGGGLGIDYKRWIKNNVKEAPRTTYANWIGYVIVCDLRKLEFF